MSVRAFIAVEITPDLQAALAGIQDILGASGSAVKWVEPGNLHLTLRFLGGVEEEELQAVGRAVEKVAAAASTFEMGLAGIGAFPGVHAPRVVWVGVTAGRDQLTHIAQGLETAVAELGFEPERRPFRAHLTLGRVRRPKPDPQLAELIRQRAQDRVGRMNVTELSLLRSDLTPRGPIYTTLGRFPLPGGQEGTGLPGAK